MIPSSRHAERILDSSSSSCSEASTGLQLGLTATPRELEEIERPLTATEQRRDTYHYFGDPIFTYTLKQAIEDGYLVPYLLEERITNVDKDGFTGPDGTRYTTATPVYVKTARHGYPTWANWSSV
jgi:superfamily II DNA or RNA helicase